MLDLGYLVTTIFFTGSLYLGVITFHQTNKMVMRKYFEYEWTNEQLTFVINGLKLLKSKRVKLSDVRDLWEPAYKGNMRRSCSKALAAIKADFNVRNVDIETFSNPSNYQTIVELELVDIYNREYELKMQCLNLCSLFAFITHLQLRIHFNKVSSKPLVD